VGIGVRAGFEAPPLKAAIGNIDMAAVLLAGGLAAKLA
jgi:hypothetical protein